MAKRNIRVLITDDQVELALELKNVLSTDDEIEVVGIAADGEDAVRKTAQLRPDVVLMDIRMPNMSGVVATKHIKADYPNVKILILTTFDDSDYILNAINHGASGYLLKDTGATALLNAIKNAYDGDTILPAKIAQRIASAAKNVTTDREIKLSRAFPLSDREIEIALMMYEGFTNRQISSALKLSEGTTRNYVSSIYVKTDSQNRAEAIAAIKSVL